MKTYNNLYDKIYSMGNLTLAWRKARKGKTGREDVLEFEENIERNLLNLHYELKNLTYRPQPLETFVLRDPKTRIISKSHFRDRVVHHGLIKIIKPIFESRFIFDSCAGRKGKGALFAVKRFEQFARKITNNFADCGFCLKADIKHYFPSINHEILIRIISERIKDEKVIWLIRQILENNHGEEKGMPLGNYTSQFFANVYLDKFDHFVKEKLKAKFYIRYVDDFIWFGKSRKTLVGGMREIDNFLKKNLKIELHNDKTKIVSVYQGIDFVGFRNFPASRLLRARNIRKMKKKIEKFEKKEISFLEIHDIFKGWNAYAKWSNSKDLQEKFKIRIISALWSQI